jgi:innexin
LYFLQLINIIGINYLFSGFWNVYAPAISALFSTDYDEWVKSNSKVFPKIAKCDFQNYGPSGSIQKKDAMCILTLNILNEKLFAFLWVYFILLASISGFNMLYRLITLVSYHFRAHLVIAHHQSTNNNHLKRVFKKCQHIGDWFVLYQLSRNLNPVIFKDLMMEMSTIEQQKYYISNEEQERFI